MNAMGDARGGSSDSDTASATVAAAPHAFARLRMDGEGFKHARLPIEALAELQRYRSAVLQGARLAWEKQNPGEELPGDFFDSFKLALTDVEDGSATSVLERPSGTAYDAFYEAGRAEVEREIEVLESWLEAGAPMDSPIDVMSLPLLSEPSFVALGSSIASTASFTIASPSSPIPKAVTERLRNEAIVPLAHERERLTTPAAPAVIERHSVEGEVAGRLVSLNAETKSFDMVSLRFGKLHGRYRGDELTADLRAVLNSRTRAPVVRITATMRLVGEDVKSLLNATAVQLLEIDGQPWSRRFIELASLDGGWDDEMSESRSVAFEALDAARDLLHASVEAGRPIPGIFPLASGGVQLEWASPEFITSIEISPDLQFELFDLEVASRIPEHDETTDMAIVKAFINRTVR